MGVISTRHTHKNREKRKRAQPTHLFFETDNRPLRRPSIPCNNANRRNHRRCRDQTLLHPLLARTTSQDRAKTLLISFIWMNSTLRILTVLRERGTLILSGTAKATADVHCDVMAASTTSLHPWPTPDANINRATSGELMGDAPTAPAYVDNSLKKSTSPDSSTTTSATERNRKRQRNTEAARRYRQRKVDRTAELEEALAAVSGGRD